MRQKSKTARKPSPARKRSPAAAPSAPAAPAPLPAGTSFRLDPENARSHPPENQALIRQSLQEVGPFRSIGVDGEGIVRVGNGVFEQARALGIRIRAVKASPDELIAVVRDDLIGDAAERAAMFDNRAGELSVWNHEVLGNKALVKPAQLVGIFDPSWIARLKEVAHAGDGSIIPVDNVPSASPSFAEGEQYNESGGYVALVFLKDDQHNDPKFKKALEDFCRTHGIEYKIRKQ